MKKTIGLVLALFLVSIGNVSAKKIKKVAPPKSTVSVNRLVMKGQIVDDENILFNLQFTANAESKGILPIAGGKISQKTSKLTENRGFFSWGGDIFSILSKKGAYYLEAESSGKCDVSFDFFSRVEKKGIWRESTFALLPAIARVVEIHSKRKDIEIEIPGALKVIKKDAPNGDGVIFHAALPPEGVFKIKWRSHVENLDAKLVVNVAPVIVAEVMPGTVHTNSVFNYKIIQGRLSSLSLEISDDLSILNVNGADIQDWRVEKTKEGRFLRISLSRKFEKTYTLSVRGEKVLPKFPCSFSLPKILPQDVLRIDGYLSFGTNKAVKLIIGKVSGLNQVDTRSFPIKMAGCKLPKRSLYTYTFSGNKYSLESQADNIQPSYSVDLYHTVNFKDEDMLVKSDLNMDVKDAPLRELIISFPADFSVNRVVGRSVIPDDYEVLTKSDKKYLKIPFRKNTMGKVNLEISIEKNISKSIADSSKSKKTLVEIPSIYIDKAKSVRGELLLAAARGLSLEGSEMKNLRKIHPSSASTRIPGLQLSYKFKGQDWSGKVSVTHEKTSFISEIFHLASVGEGSIYGMSMFTYRISGAPVDKIVIALNKSLKNPEFTGGNIIDWKQIKGNKTHNLWQVNFREKLFGDYMLLATYETILSNDAPAYRIGDVFTVGSDAESGFIVISSKRNLEIKEKTQPGAVIEIEQSEVPEIYKRMVQNPILNTYKFYKSPHWVDASIKGYTTEQLVGTGIDFAMLSTRINKNGEIVTDVKYRLKNAQAQFLSIRLPKNAEPWTVTVDEKSIRVSESEKEEGLYLIPIPRKTDIDTITEISITYAQELDSELGAGTTLSLTAPKLDIDTMQVTWGISVPDKYDFINFDGNMETSKAPRPSGFSGCFSFINRWFKAFTKSGLIPPYILITVLGAILALSWGKKKLVIFSSITCGIGILYGLSVALPAIRECLRYKMTAPPVNNTVFAKLYTMAADTPTLNIRVEDMQASSLMKIVIMMLYLVLAIGIFRMAAKRRSAILAGIGTTIVIVAFSKWLSASMLIAILTASLIPVAMGILLWIIIFKRAKSSLITSVVTIMLLCFGTSSLQASELKPIVIESVTYDITASNKEIQAIGHFVVKADKPGTILIVPAPAAITGDVPENSSLKIERKEKHYYLKVKSSGTYKFDLKLLLPLRKERNGIFTFPLPLPDANKNIVNGVVTEKNFELTSPNAVSFKRIKTENSSAINATFISGTHGYFLLKPQKREIKNEKVQFFANTTAVANFAGGFVEINYYLNMNIAQGEIAKFALEIPENMGVTAVSVPDLSAWKYNQETDILEVFLSQPHSNSLTMQITAQIANCTLPYEKEIAMLKVQDAGKQHGTIGVAADSSVQLEVLKLTSLTKINTDDFTHGTTRNVAHLKKAFRYYKTPAKVTIKAMPVEPEIRVTEKTMISFEDEKTTMTSSMAIEISKAGLFSVTLNLPDKFDVDKLTGSNIRHWDEVSDKKGHRVIVHFDRKILGTTPINIELISEKDFGKETIIPKITVNNARKQKGSLSINLERGTRIDVKKRRGIELKTATFATSLSDTAQNFSIIRPDWMLKVTFEIAKPWVQAENLQIAKIADGSVSFTAIFNYKIENAGVKHFTLKLPKDAEVPEFIGNDILDSAELEKGIWKIKLKKKANSYYRLLVKYRIPYSTPKALSIVPIQALDFELQKGYFAIFTEDSIQIKPKKITGELSDFDARKIPDLFNKKNLSNAVKCYRSVGTDYSIDLILNRHKAAKLLRAKIQQLKIESIVSSEGNIMTRMMIHLDNIGNENLLKLELPANSRLWSVLIDHIEEQKNPGLPVEVAEEKGKFLVPLKQKKATQIIEIIYSAPAGKDWRLSSQFYDGPKFDLPLNNISWTLYLPEQYKYDDFSGTLEYNYKKLIPKPPLSISKYDSVNKNREQNKKNFAKQWLTKANNAEMIGDHDVANDAFRNAEHYAQNDVELQEDVQGQLKNAQEKNVSKLLQERSVQMPQLLNMKMSNSALSLPLKTQMSRKDRTSFKTIFDKAFTQQKAASTETKPLLFTIPKQGEVLNFTRTLQKDRNTSMKIIFEATPALKWKTFNPFYAGIVLTILLAIFYKLAALAVKREKEEQEEQAA